jgi:hypothetical protein
VTDEEPDAEPDVSDVSDVFDVFEPREHAARSNTNARRFICAPTLADRRCHCD